jgi:hypothetical protein
MGKNACLDNIGTLHPFKNYPQGFSSFPIVDFYGAHLLPRSERRSSRRSRSRPPPPPPPRACPDDISTRTRCCNSEKTNMTICQDISRARFNETCRIRFTLARLRRCKKMFAYLLSAENKSYSIWAKTRTRYHLQEGGQIRVARFFLTQYIYQNEGKYTKLPQHYQTAIKYSK